MIPFDNLMVNLIKPEENVLGIAYASGMDIPARRKGDQIPFRGSVCEVIALNRKGILFMSDSGEEMIKTFPTLVHVQQAGLRSMTSVPLISHERVIGGLTSGRKNRTATTNRSPLLRKESAPRSPVRSPTLGFSPIEKRRKFAPGKRGAFPGPVQTGGRGCFRYRYLHRPILHGEPAAL